MTSAPASRETLAPRCAPTADRLLVLRAGAWLLVVDLGLRTVGFSRLRRWLDRRPAARAPAPAPTPGGGREAERLLDAVRRAASSRPHRPGCLPRALALQRLLAGRGIPSELRFGVRREAGELAAHAWVECGGRALDPEPRAMGRFAALG